MSQKPTFDYDYIVIGSGAGGSPVASILASAGKKVAVVEKSTFGGESPNWGDVPTGFMSYTINTYQIAKNAAKFGLRTNSVGYNYPSLLSWKDVVTKRTGAGGNRRYYEKQGISVFAGNAHFLSPNEIAVNRRHLSARKFLIATGSDWQIPKIPGLENTTYHTPKTIFNLKRLPKTIFVIGSSTAALELAHILSVLGTKVYIAEESSRILPNFDEEVSSLLTNDAKKNRNISVLTYTKVISIQKSSIQKRVTFLQGQVEKSVRVDEILIANQQIPATDLGLENAGVKYTRKGVSVDSSLRTSARHIFAAGSVVDAAIQTHEVLSQSRIAAHNLLHNNRIKLDNSPRLQVAFTQPEIAQVGMNEDDCRKKGIKVKMAIVPLTATVRSNITDQRTGFVKLIINQRRVIIGATIVGPHASDIIAELSLAIRHKITSDELAATPHCFTSWSEAVRIAAGKLL
jgi:hypothetical protein